MHVCAHTQNFSLNNSFDFLFSRIKTTPRWTIIFYFAANITIVNILIWTQQFTQWGFPSCFPNITMSSLVGAYDVICRKSAACLMHAWKVFSLPQQILKYHSFHTFSGSTAFLLFSYSYADYCFSLTSYWFLRVPEL